MAGNRFVPTFISPGLTNFDLSDFQEFAVREKNRLQLQTEFFNLFNRASFGNPIVSDILGNRQVNRATGQVLTTPTNSRQIFFALMYIF